MSVVYRGEEARSTSSVESSKQIGSLRRGRKPGKKNRPLEERKRQEQDPEEMHRKKLEKREKEQERCKNIKSAFRVLQEKLGLPEKALLNRIDVLHYATDYIKHLSSQLEDQPTTSVQQEAAMNTQEQLSLDDMVWLPYHNNYYTVQQGYDSYCCSEPAAGYGYYPYQEFNIPDLHRDNYGYYNTSTPDTDFSYESQSLTPSVPSSGSLDDVNTWYSGSDITEDHNYLLNWNNSDDIDKPVFAMADC